MKLKKWVVKALVIINILALCIMASECDSLSLFMVSHITALGIFALNSKILKKYGRI